MSTCKECEHYQGLNFDGPMRTTDGEKAVMFCPKLVDTNGGNGYHKDILRCSNADGFTPKKPVKKSCKTCGISSYNNGTNKTCTQFLGIDKVPTEYCDDSYSGWQPIKPVKPKAEVAKSADEKDRDYKAHVNLLNARLKRQKEHYQEQLLAIAEKPKETTYWDRGYSVTELRDPEKPKPLKSKENTMSRAKKLIRKYVMACTLYCTAVICVALNPWVYKLWHWLIPALDEIKGNLDKPFVEYAGHWVLTILSIAAIALAIHAFNKATDFIFGKLEK